MGVYVENLIYAGERVLSVSIVASPSACLGVKKYFIHWCQGIFSSIEEKKKHQKENAKENPLLKRVTQKPRMHAIDWSREILKSEERHGLPPRHRGQSECRVKDEATFSFRIWWW
jgi:hypothetical protein